MTRQYTDRLDLHGQDSRDLHDVLETSQRPLNQLDEADLCPGNKMLVNINASLR